MKTTTRLAALGVAGLLTAGITSAVLVSSASAGARYNGSPVGTIDITPTPGTNDSAINYTTSAACPSGDSFYTLLFGAGMPDAGEIVTSKTSAGFSTSAPIKSAFQNTPQYYATKNSSTLSGTYDVVLRCTTGLSNASNGDFRSTITFSSPTAYTATAGGSAGGPLALSTSTPSIEPNHDGIFQATGSANTTFELMCYSRPNTSFTSARKQATTTGNVTFTIRPGTNTKCYVRYLDDTSAQSPSVVINVRTTLSLSAVKTTGVRTYIFQGRNLPQIAGQLITLYRVDSTGREIRTTNLTTDSSGIYRVNRSFTGVGTFTFLVRTSQTLNNAAGKSAPYRITIT